MRSTLNSRFARRSLGERESARTLPFENDANCYSIPRSQLACPRAVYQMMRTYVHRIHQPYEWQLRKPHTLSNIKKKLSIALLNLCLYFDRYRCVVGHLTRLLACHRRNFYVFRVRMRSPLQSEL